MLAEALGRPFAGRRIREPFFLPRLTEDDHTQLGMTLNTVFDVVSSDSGLDTAVLHTVDAVNIPGAFGFNYSGFSASAVEVADQLEERPDLESALEEPAQKALRLSGLNDDDVIDLSKALGWWERLASNRDRTLD